MKFIIALLLSSLLLLSSCSHQIQNNPDDVDLTDSLARQLSEIPDTWELKGRISITDEQSNWYAHFYWKKQQDKFLVSFKGPLGETHLQLEQVRLDQNKQKNTLRIGEDSYTSNGDIESLLAQHSNIFIPVNSLQYWIFGRFNPAYPKRVKLKTIDESEKVIEELFQQNWKIRFSRYDIFKPGQLSKAYPSRISAKDEQYSIKLFISSRL